MTDHCSRSEILAGARAGRLESKAARDHVAGCDECRLLWDLACEYVRAYGVRLDHAPSGWVERAAALAKATRPTKDLVRALAGIVFDSWATPAVAGLRSSGTLDARRLTWDAGDWSVELRAELAREGWDLVAQVQHRRSAASGISLQFDRDQVHTDASGIAVWSGKKPPKQIVLVTPEGALELEAVSWTRPRST